MEAAKTSVAPSGITGYESVIDEVRRLYADGEADAALDLARSIHAPRPKAQLGLSLDAVPRVILDRAEVQKLPIDHRAGFLLAHIDGASSLGTILEVMDASGMMQSEATAIIESLLAFGAIEL